MGLLASWRVEDAAGSLRATAFTLFAIALAICSSTFARA